MAENITSLELNGIKYALGKSIYAELDLSLERFVELLGRDFYCPTINSAPTSTTRTYLDTDDSVNTFQIGQPCRWKESDGTYRLAVLADMTESSVTWYKLPVKVSELTNDAGYLKSHQDISHLATKTELNKKQDIISDLSAIRDNAAKGATALQSVPAEYVTDTELTNKGYATTSALNSGLSGKVDKDGSKVLSTNDFTNALKSKLEGLNNYDDTTVNNAISGLQAQLNTLVGGDANTAIESFNEIIAFLDGVSDTETLEGIIAGIEQQIAGKQAAISDLSTIRSGASKGATAVQPSSLHAVATSGSYNDLSNKPTVDASLSTSSTNAVQNKAVAAGINAKYTKPSTGIPKSDLASAVQASLGKADTALQNFTETDPVFSASAAAGIKASDITNWNNKTSNGGTITGITMNGASKGTSGVVDLGTVITAHQTIKQDGITGAASNRFCSCSTEAGTAAKTANITSGTFNLEAGAKVSVKFSSANTASTPTLNINGKGAKNIFHKGSQITSGANKALLAGVVDFVYDGTLWHLVGNYVDANTSYSAGNGLTLSSNTFNVGAGTGVEVAADAISVKYGTSAGTAAQGNDSRLSDSRNPKTNSLSSEDLNNITTPGFYAGGGNNTVTNKPGGIDAFGLIVFRTADGYITQELIEGNTNAGCRWTRQYTGTTWSSWIPMPTFSATPTSGQVLVTDGTTGKVKSSGYTIAKSVPSDAKFTDTTYSSKSAASGGTDVSLVTTGEKATWNAKASTSVATTSANGLMSKDDKTKLNGIAAGATANTGTITGIKMNGASKGTSGVVDLGTVITAHQDISGKLDKTTAASTYATKTSLSSIQTQIDTLVSGNAKTAIESFNEIIAFLSGVEDDSTLEGIIAGINTEIGKKASKGDAVKSISRNGNTFTATRADGTTFTFDQKDTTYSAATQTAAGLMSAADKAKLDGIKSGATANTGTVTKVSAGTGLTGGDITSSGTIALATSGVTAGTYGDDESTRTLTHSDVFDVPQITVDSYGRVTSATTKTLTLPASGNTDTYTSAYCNTAAGTAAKAATCTGYSLLANSYLHITMVNSNSSAGALTLNVNGKGAKPVYINGSASSSSNYNLPAGTYIVYYNGSNYYFRTDGAITGKTTSVPNHSADYITGGYLNIHPENGPTLIPMINNDIAYLLKRGGSAVVKYDDVVQTVDITNVFDGSPSYWAINPTSVTTIVIELTLHKTFGWSNTIYVDFGSSTWRAKSIKVEVMNSSYSGDVWTQKGNTTSNGSGHYAIRVNHKPVGATNEGGGFNKVRFTFGSWATSNTFRIAALGIYNCGSSGLRETFVPKDGGELYGNLTPFTNGSYSLGTTAKYWGNAYINKINGVSVGSSPKFTDTTYSSKSAASGGTDVSLVTTGEKATWNAKASTSVATTSANGLMSKDDKTKLNGIAAGATANTGTITGIKMNGASKGTSGVVDLGTVITAHQDISGKLDKTTAASTYLSKTDASNTYLGKTAKAASATSADSATKATQDASGNVITSTYATKSSVNAKQDAALKFENMSASSWVSDSTYGDFPYRCDIACSGVTSSMYAEVVFSVPQAVSGDYAPMCETKSGAVSIWSSKNETITVPTILITK